MIQLLISKVIFVIAIIITIAIIAYVNVAKYFANI